MDDLREYKRIRVEDTQEALRVFFNSPDLRSDMGIEAATRELFSVVGVAAAMGKPMLLSLGGVESISSAFLGKLVTLNVRAKASGIGLQVCDVPPAIWPGDDGLAGVFAVLKPPPKDDSGRVYPEYDDEKA